MKYDVIVIGSGPGGYVAAIKAAQNGKKTAIVEKAELGGVCLNWGCIPTKALLKSAQVYTYAKHAAAYGIEINGDIVAPLDKIVERSRGVADTMSRGVAFLLKKNAIDVLAGRGRLAGEGRVTVTAADGSEQTVEADHIILATGSRPREMPFMPVDGRRVGFGLIVGAAFIGSTLLWCGGGGGGAAEAAPENRERRTENRARGKRATGEAKEE